MIFILASELFGELWKGEDVQITGITDNSQRIEAGNVFLCRKGEFADGADFIAEAVKRGAAAIISDRPIASSVPIIEERFSDIGTLVKNIYLPEGKKFKLIGVTGTNGKTTVTHLIKDILLSAGHRVGLIGTNGIFFDDERVEAYCSTPTTPKLCELYAVFSKLQKLGAEYIVTEVSSHALALDRVAGCEFDVGVFTNLSRDHLDFHKTMEDYQSAKEKLFGQSRVSVVNIDDRAGAQIYGKQKGEKLSVGLGYADISASALSMNPCGSEFFLEYGGEKAKISLALAGKFNVYNALSAAGACIGAKLGLAEIATGLNRAKTVKGRMERLDADAEFDVIIDYAHSPDGLEKVIHTVKGFAKGRVITVFGCGGDRDRGKRAVMGEIAGRYSDFTIITSDNPRCEDEFSIIADIYKGIKKTDGKYAVIPNRAAAIEHAVFTAAKKDVIILAGKGAEDYQIIGKEKKHFDEREIALECIKRKGTV